MPDVNFAKRLNVACDGHPHIPPYGQGRQTWLKENLAVSHEAVRKWFSGESRPRPPKMKELARKLDVDEAWLSLGITPDLEPRERRNRDMHTDGGVNAFMGLLQLNGGHCAYPDDKDPRAAFVDFYAILRGVQVPLHISLAKEASAGHYRFIVPKQFDQCRVIGLVHIHPMQVHAISLPFELLERHKIRKGGYFEVAINRKDGEYFTGADTWPRVHSLTDI